MNKLPESILAQVLPIVGHFCELNNIAAVNRRWHRVLKNAYHFISFSGTYYPYKMPCYVDIEFYCQLIQKHLKIISLNLRSCRIETNTGIQALAELLVSQPWLEILDLTNAQINLENLWSRRIELKLKRNCRDNSALHTLKLTNHINYIGFQNLVQIFQNIKKLYIGNSSLIFDDFKIILKSLKKLELLDISNCMCSKFPANIPNPEIIALLINSSLKVIITNKGKIYDFLCAQSLSNIKLIGETTESILKEIKYSSNLEKLEEFYMSGGDTNLLRCSINDLGLVNWLKYPTLNIIKKQLDEGFLIELFKILIRYGLDISFHASNEFSYINLAMKYNYNELGKFLLRIKADVYSPFASKGWIDLEDDNVPSFCPSILYAAYLENYLFLNLMFDYGLEKIDYYNLETIHWKRNCNLLCFATRHNNTKLLEFLQSRSTPHYACCFRDHSEKIIDTIETAILEENLEKIKYFPDYFVYHSSFDSLWNNKIEKTKKIIDYFIDKYHHTNELEMLNCIGDYKDSFNHKKKWPLILIAVYQENYEMVNYLVEKGFNIDASDACGITPLMIAVFRFSVEMIEHLASLGANLNKQDNFGETVLYKAVEYRSKHMASKLLEKGADPSIKSYSREELGSKIGLSPIQLAKKYSMLEPFTDFNIKIE